MTDDLKRKIHAAIVQCCWRQEFPYGWINVPPEILEHTIFDAIDGLPSAADLDAVEEEKRIAGQTETPKLKEKA